MNNQKLSDGSPGLRCGGLAFGAALCLAAWCLTAGSQTGFSQSEHSAGTTPVPLPVFEVASVKPIPAQPGFRQPAVLKCENGRLTMHNVSFMDIVSWALEMKSWDIVVPSWATPAPEQPLYDIDAVAEDPVPQAQVRLMLQRLLAERFQFAAHHELREGVQRVLRVAKGGAKLKEAAAAEPGTRPVKVDRANSRIICTGASIADFLGILEWTGGGQIFDQTGLNGRYDFTLDYRNYLKAPDPDHSVNVLTEARFDAMRAELGLEVVESKMAVDTLVVDHAEKIPTRN